LPETFVAGGDRWNRGEAVSRIGILLVTLMAPMAALGQMQVVSTSPTLNAIAAPTTTVSVTSTAP
jgi:hypothetical protein